MKRGASPIVMVRAFESAPISIHGAVGLGLKAGTMNSGSFDNI
jgi:hypothetical protein